MLPFIGMLSAFGFNYPPQSWALCEGQQLEIAQNQALFSLLGTMYGGDGRVTFRLPDLRGRGAVSFGPLDTGGRDFIQGQFFGSELVALNTLKMPAHSHTATFTPSGGGDPAQVEASQELATEPQAEAGYYIASNAAFGGDGKFVPADNAGTTVALGGVSGGGGVRGTVQLADTGQGAPFSVIQPSLAVNWSIALQGLYPSRS